MSSPFKDGVDAGLSAFLSCNSALNSASFATDPDGFADVAQIAGQVSGFVSQFQSGFQRIGENLTDDLKTWATARGQSLVSLSNSLDAQADAVISAANDGRDLATQARDLHTSSGSDSGDDGDSSSDDKKSQLEAADDKLKDASETLQKQIELMQNIMVSFHDALKSANGQFKDKIAQTKSVADGNQSKVDQALSNIRSLEDQITGKTSEEKNLFAQADALRKTFLDLCAKLDDRTAAERAADAALADGVKKDPPISASDLASLEQTAAQARQDRERAETDRNSYLAQTLFPADQAYGVKVNESVPLRAQLSDMKKQRDTLMNDMNKAKVALAQLNLEYQEPSL